MYWSEVHVKNRTKEDAEKSLFNPGLIGTGTMWENRIQRRPLEAMFGRFKPHSRLDLIDSFYSYLVFAEDSVSGKFSLLS